MSSDELVRILHDQLGHRLALLNLYASTLQRSDTLTVDEQERVKTAILSNVRAAADTLATLLADSDQGARASLAEVIKLLAEFRAAGVPIYAQLTDEIEQFDKPVSEYLLRFMREGLTNAAKHGAILGIDLRVAFDASRDLLTVALTSESSNPCPQASIEEVIAASSGLGLASLQEDAAAFGGRILVTMAPRMFTVTAELPLPSGRR